MVAGICPITILPSEVMKMVYRSEAIGRMADWIRLQPTHEATGSSAGGVFTGPSQGENEHHIQADNGQSTTPENEIMG